MVRKQKLKRFLDNTIMRQMRRNSFGCSFFRISDERILKLMAGLRKKDFIFSKRKRGKDHRIAGEIGSMLFWTLAMCFLAFVCVYLFGIRTSVIGVSMEPTLTNGQEIFIDRFSYFFVSPGRGDVIVFKPNGNDSSHYYVKRVIGVPGDTVEIRKGQIFLNGLLYVEDNTYDKIEDGGIAESEITLGEDEYFVLGDNRNNSEDSRSSNVGNVKRDYIMGKAWFHLSSADERMGFIK